MVAKSKQNRTFTLPIIAQKDGEGWGYKLRYTFDGGKQDFWLMPEQMTNVTINEENDELTFTVSVDLLRRKGGELKRIAS